MDQDPADVTAATTAKDGPADWPVPLPVRLPRPTYWPAVLAVGVVLVAWGVVTSWPISAVGAAAGALALGGWIQELRHEHD